MWNKKRLLSLQRFLIEKMSNMEHGQYIWLKIIGIEVIEIVNYHKEK